MFLYIDLEEAQSGTWQMHTPWHEKLKVGETRVDSRGRGRLGVLEAEHDEIDNIRIFSLGDRDDGCLDQE